MPFTMEINGLGPVQYTGSDYTNPVLMQAFLTSLQQFYALKTGSTPLTAADLTKIQNQVDFLSQIAENGVLINLDSADPATPFAGSSNPGTTSSRVFYLTSDMASVLKTLFTSLAPAGNINNLTLTDLNNWRNGTAAQNAQDIQTIFVYAARLFAVLPKLSPSAAASAISIIPSVAAAQIARIFTPSTGPFALSGINGSVTRSLQAFTELQYVETANQVISEQLADLQEALQSTQGALNNLNQLQQIHNNIVVNSRKFTYDLLPPTNSPNVSIDEYLTKYESYASAQLKAALVPQLNTETLPFSLPASAVTVSVSWRIVTGLYTGLTGTGSTVTIGSTTTPIANFPSAVNYTFKVTVNDPSKYYAFDTAANQFVPMPASFSISGFYLSAGVNPFTFSQQKIANLVGDGFNGVQKFPLVGSISGIQKYQVQLVRQQAALSALLVSLSAVTPASVLTDPLKRSQALIGQISTVYTDLKTQVGTYTSTTPALTAAVGVRSWIMDNYQTFSSASASNAGKLQQNITNAIVAAESSNTTQTQKVNNSMLVFQQYYQSAAAVLNQLNQMIVKMAQKISQ